MDFNALIWTLRGKEITQILATDCGLSATLFRHSNVWLGLFMPGLRPNLLCAARFSSVELWFESDACSAGHLALAGCSVFNATLISVMTMILINNYDPVDTTIYSHWGMYMSFP